MTDPVRVVEESTPTVGRRLSFTLSDLLDALGKASGRAIEEKSVELFAFPGDDVARVPSLEGDTEIEFEWREYVGEVSSE